MDDDDDDTTLRVDSESNNDANIDVDGDMAASSVLTHVSPEATFSPHAERENDQSTDFHTPVAVTAISPTVVSPSSFRASAPSILTPQAWHEFDDSVVQVPSIRNGFTRMVISSGVDARVFGFFICHMGKWVSDFPGHLLAFM